MFGAFAVAALRAAACFFELLLPEPNDPHPTKKIAAIAVDTINWEDCFFNSFMMRLQ
jgi:hypothetical protein